MWMAVERTVMRLIMYFTGVSMAGIIGWLAAFDRLNKSSFSLLWMMAQLIHFFVSSRAV